MRLLCVIDSLGPGGAQRQLTTLAAALKSRGHEVHFLVYYPDDHFAPILEAAEIPCHAISARSHWRRALAVRRILRKGWQDVVLAFMEGPSLYAELARIPRRPWGLVVSDRSADRQMRRGRARWMREGFRAADYVVTNSHTNRLMLETIVPSLRGKLLTIYNMVDMQRFCPSPAAAPASGEESEGPLRIVVAASHSDRKNLEGVVKALLFLKAAAHARPVRIDWFGAANAEPACFARAQRLVSTHGLGDVLRLHGPTQTIEDHFRSADGVGLFSFVEGLPNAVCEAMACGKPILLSNVCDAGNLVRDGLNGFLCDPASPESIASAFTRLASTSRSGRGQMGLESRRTAENLFGETAVAERFERVLKAAACREVASSDCTWPARVPESALRTVQRWTHGEEASSPRVPW